MPSNNFDRQRIIEHNGIDMNALTTFGEMIPGGFFVYKNDDFQELVYTNKSVLRIFGCDNADEFKTLTGNTFKGLVYPEDYKKINSSINEQISNLNGNNLDYVEYRIIRKDGSIRWIDDYGYLTNIAGFGEAFFVFISDITEKKTADEERFRAELALEQERHRNELKSSFFFNLSHDMHTPMNAIMGYTELAERHTDDPDYLTDCLKKIKSSSMQLLTYIDDMLEMNNIYSDKISLKNAETDLKKQLDTVIGDLNSEIKGKNIDFTAKTDIPGSAVFIDQKAFRSVIKHVLDNAVKFTGKNGKVSLSVCSDKPDENNIANYRFTVSDTGRGMSEEFLQHMFEPFEREEAATISGQNGVGLGLAIVKGTVSAMGGDISVKSRVGEGTSVTITLPLTVCVDNNNGKQGLPHPETEDGREYRILIVEDIEINKMLIEAILNDAGFVTEYAPDGSKAVEMVKEGGEGYYDLILMDIQMPVMDGYTATRTIRAMKTEYTDNLPIIAVSANSRDEDKLISIENGMNAHISKPLDPDVLIKEINAYLHGHA